MRSFASLFKAFSSTPSLQVCLRNFLTVLKVKCVQAFLQGSSSVPVVLEAGFTNCPKIL